MSIGERIKEVRKAKGYTQQAFADKLELKRNTVGGYEIGTVMPSDRTVADICSKFDVNEAWLRTGIGDRFVQLDKDEEFDRIYAQIQLSDDDFIKNIIRKYWSLDESGKSIIRQMLSGL